MNQHRHTHIHNQHGTLFNPYHAYKVIMMPVVDLGCLCRLAIISLNTLRPRRNEQHFADDIVKRIFFNENVWVSIKMSLKFVPKGLINNIPALVRIMAWRRPGDKSLSEPVMVSLLTHICVTRPQWVNTLRPRQNVRPFPDDIFKCIFVNENIRISIDISLKFIPKGPINNIPALV